MALDSVGDKLFDLAFRLCVVRLGPLCDMWPANTRVDGGRFLESASCPGGLPSCQPTKELSEPVTVLVPPGSGLPAVGPEGGQAAGSRQRAAG